LNDIYAFFHLIKLLSLRNFFIGCLFLSLIYPNADAQNQITISGHITDHSNGEVLIGMRIEVTDTHILAVSNEYGFYSVTCPAADSIHLQASGIGYVTKLMNLSGRKSVRVDIALEPATEMLDEVTITTNPVRAKLSSTLMGVESITTKEAKVLPALFGEVDILKTLQLKAGVSSGSEGSSGLYVRGGAGEQNLILLDEATVYNANHLFGFFSTFNADPIRDVRMYKGAFPAQYGGRLSSVIDVHMKEGNDKKFSATGGIGLITSRLTLEGPLFNENTTFILSGRRTYVDLITDLINGIKKNDPDFQKIPAYNFYDLNTKISTKLSANDRIFLSGYYGKDAFKLANPDFSIGFDWGNTIGTMRWNHIFNPKCFANTSLIFSDYYYNIKNALGGFDFSLGSKIRNYSLKSDFDYYPAAGHEVKAGIQMTYYEFTVGRLKAASSDHTVSYDAGVYRTAMEYAAYASDEFSLFDKLKINAGLRWSAWQQRSSFASNIEPRLGMNYELGSHWSLKAGYARMNQYVHLVSSSSLALPTDVWYPSTQIVHPQRSDQVSAGWAGSINDQILVTNEYYYKWMNHLTDFRDNADLFLNDSLDMEFEFGKGKAYGTEITIEKPMGDFTGWIAYTLAWVRKGDFPGIMNGRYYSPKYDRRHDLKIVASYRINKRWTISATWVYGSGDLAWLPIGRAYFQDVEGAPISPVTPLYGDRNSFRMPAYHRGDLSVVMTMFPRWGSSNLTLSIYNVYSRRNPYFIFLVTEFKDVNQNGIQVKVPDKITARQVSLFPILPSITYNFKF